MRQEYHDIHFASEHANITHTYHHISVLLYRTSLVSKPTLYREDTAASQKSSKEELFQHEEVVALGSFLSATNS
jgi:hypothetical protein